MVSNGLSQCTISRNQDYLLASDIRGSFHRHILTIIAVFKLKSLANDTQIFSLGLTPFYNRSPMQFIGLCTCYLHTSDCEIFKFKNCYLSYICQ